jgi:hypothetical protein
MMSERIARISEPSYVAFRLTVLLFAALLGAQCVWLLLAELSKSGIDALPTNPTAATAAAKQRDTALWAATIGAIRGDLWAQSAFTYADLLFGQGVASPNPTLISTAADARRSVDHALNNAPHQSSVWLLLAGLSLRVPSVGVDALEALKMSYYTGPSEQNLIPLRLRIATRADRFDDVQMREFASRELRVLLNEKQSSAIVEAYNIASPSGKRYIEQTVRDVDPSFLNTLLQAGSPQKQSFPH